MKNKRGDGYIGTCVMIVIICMLLSVVVTFVSAVSVINMTERNATIVLDNFVMQNSIEIYDSIKNGSDYTEYIDQNAYISQLCRYNSLDFRENTLYSISEDGSEQYRLSNVNVINTETNRLKIAAKYNITVPIYFAGLKVSEATVPVTVESKFNEKF